ncbi:GNAT family N-acetyltransferase [Nonomuraea angiospora]|uniref:RimJ/RimL family protein N-acetyltransferase n=1 Tax=Nonomuraea angiospora TaxID=46172 RepID=A0ABR9MHX0_9ACTN|nr:GNAT family N-acetyltransferase [Nonomuraea angiospora]MBE1592505.1 RimJ/RimL family protein N-acetyltransferase [Nonomuraea angiospora]
MTTDLLRIELGVVWRLDGRGRLPGPEELVIGVAADGLTAAVRADVPDPVATELLDLVSQGVPSSPGHPPDVLARCDALLGGGRAVSGGPCYLVRPPLTFEAPADVITSDDPSHAARLRPLRPAGWEPEEWDELLAGGAGAPWAMIVEDGQVAAICHSARLTPEGAEAGAWTSPAFRGRGYAAATTAAWAGLLPGVRLFYSTSADNHSSQRVAGRLGLDAIGWLWQLTPRDSTASPT